MSTLSVALYTFSFAKVFSISFLKDKSRNYKSTILSAQNDIQEAGLSGSKHDPASIKKTLKSLSKASVKLASLNDGKLNPVIDALNAVCKTVEKKKFSFDISKLFADVPMDKAIDKVCSCRKRKVV